MNSLKHGLTALRAVLPGEDPDEYESHISSIVASLSPVGALELELANQIAKTTWRLRRTDTWEAAQARLHAECAESDIQKQLEDVDDQIRGMRADISRLQLDPESEPPLIVRLGDLPDTASVDAIDVNVLYLDWASQLPDSIAVPELGELCRGIGLPELKVEEDVNKLDLSPETTDPPQVGSELPAATGSPQADILRPPTSPLREPIPHQRQNATDTCAPTDVPAPTAEPSEKAGSAPTRTAPDPVDRLDWQAVHVQRLVQKLAAVLGLSAEEYVHDAETRWRAEMTNVRASRTRRRAELRADIKKLELRKHDLVASQGVPESLRLDLLVRYGTAETRRLERLLKAYRELQRERLHEDPSRPKHRKRR
jgi:hypothetical protein